MSATIKKPNFVYPLAPTEVSKGIAGSTALLTNSIGQRKVNAIYEVITNPITGKSTIYLCKRPGVAATSSTFGTSGQAAYLWDIAAQASTSSLDTNYWVYSTSGNDVRASSSSTTTVIVTAAGYRPAFVDHTAISGVDTVVLQIRNASGVQKAYYSQAIGSWTEITDGVFAALTKEGKAEHLDGFMFILDRPTSRIYNSNLNTVATWSASGYITKLITMDIPTGLAKLGNQLIAFGESSMEVFRNTGNATGSPLSAVPELTQPYGLLGGIYVDQTHYTAVLNKKLYWVGQNPKGVYAYNGQTVEKVSNIAVDKILSERATYSLVGTTSFSGQSAIVIGLDVPSATTQRALLFFPKWNDWFEWSSATFTPWAPSRKANVFLGVGTNQHKLYQIVETADTYTDAGALIDWRVQFDLPYINSGRKRMSMLGLSGVPSPDTVAVTLSDDNWSTSVSAGSVDMTAGTAHCIFRLGSFYSRSVRLANTGNTDVRLESFLARIN